MSGQRKARELLITVLRRPEMMGYLCVVWPKAIPVPPGSPRIASCSRTLWWSPSLHSSDPPIRLQEVQKRPAAIPGCPPSSSGAGVPPSGPSPRG